MVRMLARILTIAAVAATFAYPSEVRAQEGPCAGLIEPFNGFWMGGQIRVSKRIVAIPIVVTTRFSYREIRYSPCAGATPLLPPGIGEASIGVGVPLFNNRRGGWLLQMAAKGQGSQRPGDPVSGLITGAPATAFHVNLWETALPLIQFTGAASAAIMPQSREFAVSLAYLGGVRVYPLYAKHAQANLGLTMGGSNADVNFIPAMAFRVSDLAIWNHRIALGVELRSPMGLTPGPTPFQWRLWGALHLALDEPDEGTSDRVRGTGAPSRSYDLVRSPPEAAPPAQTAWEMTL